MSRILEQIERTLPSGMYVPKPFEQLFSWIEARGYYVDTEMGRCGFLYPEEKLKAEWTESERPGGTIIEFMPEVHALLTYWLGENNTHLANRLCVFSKTGADGSRAAFWIDDAGKQRIVHLGSGSGSVLTCVLTDDAVDFIRLIAIGYDEICWNEEFANPPNFNAAESGLFVHPNTEFQEWVTETFDTTIPNTASEIVLTPAEMDQEECTDDFHSWLSRNAT